MAEVLKKKTSPGENKRKAEVLRSLAEEEARKLEETAGNGNDRDKDEELDNTGCPRELLTLRCTSHNF